MSFDDAHDFSESMVAAKEDKLWGYIDKTGGWAVMPRFAMAYQFVDGLALVQIEKQWAYIDITGRIVRENVWNGSN